MNNEIQASDLFESFKAQISAMSYDLAYKDGMIEALKREIHERDHEIEYLKKSLEAATSEKSADEEGNI